MKCEHDSDGRRPGGLEILRLTTLLAAIAVVLFICSLTTQFLARQLDMDPNRFAFAFFNLDVERNVPTTFQALLLLGSAIFLGGITLLKWSVHDGWRWHWAGLSGIFVLLAWDEIVEVHEHLIHILRPYGFSGILYFAWIIPAAFAVVIFALTYLRFMVALPNPPRNGIVLAGVIYVTSIFLFEAIGGWYFDRIDEQINMQYVLLTSLEEAFEMAALIFLLHTLARQFASLLSTAAIELHSDPGHIWLRVRWRS